MWSQDLKCKVCGNTMNMDEEDVSITCEKCGKKYTIIEKELSYATASSGTNHFYEIDDEDNIKQIYFYNQPRDLLDEAYQNALLAGYDENPHVLCPIVKKFHDALKKRLQKFLSLGTIPNLSNEEKEEILQDKPMRSIMNLFDILKRAFPGNAVQIDTTLSMHGETIKRMKWVRDKSEHGTYDLWSMPGRIYEDRNEEPNSGNPPKDILNYAFIKKANDAVIDCCTLLLDLDPSPRGEDQYQILKDYSL